MRTFIRRALKNKFQRGQGGKAEKCVRNRPGIESLEERCLLSGQALSAAPAVDSAKVAAQYAQLPLSFVPNVGQFAEPIQYVASGSGYALALSSTGAALSLQTGDSTNQSTSQLQMQLVGANASAAGVGLNAQSSVSNYFLGSDPSQWHSSVTNFNRVEFANVYQGINLTYYGNQRQLEYDFDVTPGADPNAISLSFSNAQSLAVDASGNLVISIGGAQMTQHAPVLYQVVNGQRQEVSGHYVIGANNQVHFQVGAYDHTQTLVIDPLISYASFFGGSDVDTAQAVAVDGAGDIFITGSTSSVNFPMKGSLQGSLAGSSDVFVAEFDPSGTNLLFSTYLGGGGIDNGMALRLDAAGNVYVAGETTSGNFPAKNAAQSYGGGGSDGFVFELSPGGGQLVFSTPLGGNGVDFAQALAIDQASNIYVAGFTYSTNFLIKNALQPNSAGGKEGWITKLAPGGAGVIYSTYLGGKGDDGIQGIGVDASGNVVVVGDTLSANFPVKNSLQPYGGGDDAFVAKINPNGTALLFSTYLGGSSDDRASAVRQDAQGNIYVVGSTTSANFPIVGGFQSKYAGNGDAFVAKLSSNGANLLFSTYLGGSDQDQAYGLTLDSSNDVFVVGATYSTNFPTVQATQPTFGGNGASDAFLSEVAPDGAVLSYSTYLGGTSDDRAFGVAVGSDGAIYLVGSTASSNFPTVHATQGYGGGNTDAFVVKLINVPASHYSLATPSTTAGNLFNLTVTALTPQNTSAGSYRGTIHFSSTDPLAVLPPDYTFTADDNGAHTFTGLQLRTVGNQTITVTDVLTPALTVVSSNITVGALVSTFRVVDLTSNTTTGASNSITVSALDANGNVATAYTGAVHFTSSDAQAALPPDYTFTSSDHGVHTFSGAVFHTVGIQSVTATDTGLPGVRGTSSAITVAAPPTTATALVVTGVPTSVTPGAPQTFTITAVDGANHTVTGYTGTVHFTSTDKLAILPADYTFTSADNGTHTFTSGATFNTAGVESLSATDVQAGLSGSESGITVLPVVSGILLSATGSPTAGTNFALTVTIVDENGIAIPDYTGTVHLSSSDPNAVLPADYTFKLTDAGIHTFSVNLHTSGPQTITIQDTVDTSLSATAGVNVQVTPTQLVVTSAPTTNAGNNVAVTVKAEDEFGNIATGYTGTVHMTSTDAKAILVSSYTFKTGDQGVKTFASIALATAGQQTISVQDANNAGLGVGGDSVLVNPGVVASLVFLTQPVTGVSGTTISPAIDVKLFDAFGNVATNSSQPVTLAVSGGDVGTAKLAGSTTVTPHNGIADFANVSVTGFGTHIVLQARSGTVADNSTPFNSIPLSSILPVVVAPVIYGPPPNSSAIEAYVKGVYRTLLGRDFDPPGLSFWVSQIAGGVSRTAIIESFWNSPENRGREVDAYYEAYLGRPADPGGRAFWIGQLQNGADETAIVDSFLLSAEELQAPNDVFVQRLYQGALGRSAAASEISFWLGQLASGATRQQVTNEFVFSPEAAGVAIDSYYGAFLQRPSDPQGRAFWVNMISTQQASYASVAKSLLASDEFFANAAKATP